MQLNHLLIENFRGIGKFDADMKPVTVLFGPNGTGKSTILDAIRFLLVGAEYDRINKNRKHALSVLTDHTGTKIPVEANVGPHGDKATIEALLEHNGKTVTLKCVIGSRVILDTNPALPGTDKRQAVFDFFGLNAQQCRLALDPVRLLLSDDLLDSLTGQAGFTANDAAQAFEKYWPDLMRWLESRNLPFVTATDLDAAAKAAFEERTGTNRCIKELEGMEPVQEPVNSFGKRVSLEQYDAVVQALQGLQQQRNDLYTALGTATAGRTQDVIDADKAEAQSKLEKLKRPVKPKQKCLPANIWKDAHFDEANKRIETAKEKRAEVIVRLSACTAVLDLDAGATCPTCSQVVADEHMERIAIMAESLETEKADLDEVLATEMSIYRDESEKKATWLSEGQEKERQYKESIEQFEQEQQQWANRLAQLKAEEPCDTDAAEIEAELATLQTRLDAGSKVRDRLVELKQYKEQMAELPKLVKHVEFLTNFIGMAKAPATRALLAGDAVADFLERTNGILEAFGHLMAVEDGTLMLVSETEGTRPVRQASDGELLLCSMAIADSIGEFGVACVDRFESVDVVTRSLLMQLLLAPLGGRILAYSDATLPKELMPVGLRVG